MSDQPYRIKFRRDLDALTGSPEATDALLTNANAAAGERIERVVIDEHQQGVVMAGWLLTFPEVLAAVLPDMLAEANARAEAAEAKLEAVRALHASSGNEQSQGYDAEGNYGYISPYCVGCEAFDEYAVAWPCATIRAVDGTEEAGA